MNRLMEGALPVIRMRPIHMPLSRLDGRTMLSREGADLEAAQNLFPFYHQFFIGDQPPFMEFFKNSKPLFNGG